MFSHHSLIRSRTNHHQKSILPTSTTSIAYSCCNRCRNQPQPKEQVSNKQNQPELIRTCAQLSTLNFERIFTIFLYFDICTLCVRLFTLIQFCTCVYVLFCFSSGSMILQSSLKFLLLGLKRSHFKFNILKVHFSEKMEDLH